MTRFALVSLAIVAFMLAVRPFGLSIDGFPALMVVLGLAPLNFMLMFLLHSVSMGKGWKRAAWSAVVIIGANILYISIMSGDRPDISLSVKIIVIASLVFAAASLWNRERSLLSEVLELRSRPKLPFHDALVFRGENDRDIIRLDPKALCYVKADGNYVQVHFTNAGAPTNRLLRTTLKTIMGAVPDGLLVQCHRSYAVNLGSAQQIVMRGGRMDIEFMDGSRVPVSRSFRAEIRKSAKT